MALSDEDFAILEAQRQVGVAFLLAHAKHGAQKRWNGDPYITHLVRVACGLKHAWEVIVALLHDIVEDTDVTLKDLENYGFNSTIVSAIDRLTHRKDESYDDYITRLSTNPLAVKIKLKDLADNMKDLPPGERRDRYERATKLLSSL